MRLPHGLLVDMDGTLVDSESRWLTAEIALMTELGGTWTREDQVHCVGGPLDRLIRYMIDRVGEDLDPTELGERLLVLVEQAFLAEPLTWRESVVGFVQQAAAHEIPAALVTASDRPLVDIVLDQLQGHTGGELFSAVVAGGETIRGKPHPDPYLRAAELLAISPRQALALEDSPTGVRAAVAAGCGVIAIPHVAPVEVPGAIVVGDFSGHTLVSLWSLARDHRLEN